MRFKTRLFIILWLAGLAGVFSFLLVDLSALVANFPAPPGTEVPPFTWDLKLLSLIQPTVLMSLAVFIGIALAPKIGLSSPMAQAAANGEQVISAFKPQIVPGIVGGLAGGIALSLISILWKPFLPPDFVERGEQLEKLFPLLTRLFYGGITEELLLRWGLMTLLVWAAWRLFQKGEGKPQSIYFLGSILVSSIIFGIGHLPIVFMLSSVVTASLIFYIVFANAVFGLIAGCLYWKKGLEAAILAHMLAHVVMLTASYFGA